MNEVSKILEETQKMEPFLKEFLALLEKYKLQHVFKEDREGNQPAPLHSMVIVGDSLFMFFEE